MADKGIPPKLIIIDTLARNFGPGSENSTEDMSLFINHVDTHLRIKFHCTVLLVHHTGHGAVERGRGSSALKAAVDTEYCMSKNQQGTVINLSCTKNKDAPHAAPKSFAIAAIDLGIIDPKGHAANGPVLVETQYSAPEPKDKGLGKNQKAALDILEELIEQHRENFIEEGKNPDDAKVTLNTWQDKTGMNRHRFKEVKDALLEREYIVVESGFVSLS